MANAYAKTIAAASRPHDRKAAFVSANAITASYKVTTPRKAARILPSSTKLRANRQKRNSQIFLPLTPDFLPLTVPARQKVQNRCGQGAKTVTNGAATIKPLIPESSTSESTNVEVVLGDLRDGVLDIPDYQRDSDQWSATTKSLLVESIINNLSIPAFFFEVVLEGAAEKNYVVDGQQRLTTLQQFFLNKLRLVESEDAPYLSPDSVHYAGKTFDELPPVYQQAFKRYRLTVIKLRNLGAMKLEVFRRINHGGTPLSGQDIRLAYYGSGAESLALIRLIGIFDPRRHTSERFIKRAKEAFAIDYPWTDEQARQGWQDWWEDKEIAKGQTASEMFLWSVVSAQQEKLNTLLSNKPALQSLNCRFNRAIDEALDVVCAQMRYQDTNKDANCHLLMTFPEIKEKFFPAFQKWIGYILAQKGTNLPVSKHRMVAAVIGAAYASSVNPDNLKEQQWTDLVEFIRRPQEMAQLLEIAYPQSRGRWDGAKGYKAQLDAVHSVVKKVAEI